MGVWGIHNFENDYALDYLDSILKEFVSQINKYLSDEVILNSSSFLEKYGEYKVIPTIDILVTLCEQYTQEPPVAKTTVADWKVKYLRIFDKDEDMYSFDFKADRRSVIETTFTKLDGLITI